MQRSVAIKIVSVGEFISSSRVQGGVGVVPGRERGRPHMRSRATPHMAGRGMAGRGLTPEVLHYLVPRKVLVALEDHQVGVRLEPRAELSVLPLEPDAVACDDAAGIRDLAWRRGEESRGRRWFGGGGQAPIFLMRLREEYPMSSYTVVRGGVRRGVCALQGWRGVRPGRGAAWWA